jgi:catechol 2,3-dioxygenase-like lactoylglutathione lyase family enzyme
VIVSNMDRAVRFYTEVLGLKLKNRFGDHWATVVAGNGLTIGRRTRSSALKRARGPASKIPTEIRFTNHTIVPETERQLSATARLPM